MVSIPRSDIGNPRVQFIPLIYTHFFLRHLIYKRAIAPIMTAINPMEMLERLAEPVIIMLGDAVADPLAAVMPVTVAEEVG